MHEAGPFFDELAASYDAFYEAQDLDDVPFYRELASEVDGPILEVGCGSGRISLELLRDGNDVHGIDVSGEMLSILERKAERQGLEPSVRQADMRDFEPGREYALIIVPFRAFLHNLTVEDQQAALRTLRAALRPGGRLVLDTFVPSFDVICETYGTAVEQTVNVDGERLTVTDHPEIEDEVEQVAVVRRTVERAGEVVGEARFSIALISKREFELLFETTGWTDWTGYGGFDRQQLTDGADTMVWIAER